MENCVCIRYDRPTSSGGFVVSASGLLDHINSDTPTGSLTQRSGIVNVWGERFFAKAYRNDSLEISGFIIENWLRILGESINRLSRVACPVGAVTHKCLRERGILVPRAACRCTARENNEFISMTVILHEFVDTSNTLSGVFEDLHQREREPLEEQAARRFFCRFAEAMFYFKTAGVVHGDLNNRNIILDFDNNSILIIDTDGLIPAYMIDAYNLLFYPGDLGYIKNFIEKKFKEQNKMKLFFKNIDYFMFVYDAIYMAALASDNAEVINLVDACCEGIPGSKAERFVEKVLGLGIVRNHLRHILEDPVKHVSRGDPFKRLLTEARRGPCKGL